MKNIIDEFGRSLVVDESQKKLYTFNNRENRITWAAPIFEDGKPTVFWTNYNETGTIEDIEKKLSVWNNKLLLKYSQFVDFDAQKNDPDRVFYKKFINWVKKNEERFFDEYGDFKKNIIINDKDILALISLNKGD